MPESAKKSFVIFTYFVLILGTLLVFRQVHNFAFVNYDDTDYVYENPHVLNGLTGDGIIWAFTTNHTANWHPLTWLSLMLDCQLFGANPGWMHLVNLLLHIANTLLLFALLRKMTGALWPSAFVAAAFAIHPMHVESVAWIAERKDVLSTLFLLLTLAAYVSYVKRRSLFRYMLTVLLFALGLLVKPMLVTLPILLLLLDYWPLERIRGLRTEDRERKTEGVFQKLSAGQLIAEKIPFIALSLVSSVITFLVQLRGSAVAHIDALSLKARIANAFISYTRYTGKLFWPQNLAVFYPFDADSFAFWQVVMCVLLLLVISIFVICFGRNQKYLPVGWFWFVATLVPVIGFVQVGQQALADRYTYLPYTGLFIMIAWGLPELLSKSKWPQKKIGIGLSMVIVLTTLGICTHQQVSYWNNSFTLFSHAIEVTQNNYIAYNNLGVAYNSVGRYQDAIEAYKQTIRIKPDHETYFNLGVACGKLGRQQDEVEAYKQAIRIKPDYALAYINLGDAYNNLGRYQDAIETYKRVIIIKPDYAEAYFNLGVAYGELGHQQDEIEAYKQAIRIKPDYAEAYYNLGVSYEDLGRYQDAVEAYKQTIRIKPDYSEAYINLGITCYKLGRYQDAIETYKQAIRIKPDYAEAHYHLGVAYLVTGDKGLALEEYKILKTLDVEKANELFKLINK
ncbi:MAG: tetratricopeptide repeat protein [Sedimentisphaerales bacterium]|jgi:tetratricopeptide (TPR) repeat protein